MYREKTTNEQYYYLQETRRACYWSYKQSVKLYIQLFFTNKTIFGEASYRGAFNGESNKGFGLTAGLRVQW